jgi:hypothetical protein
VNWNPFSCSYGLSVYFVCSEGVSQVAGMPDAILWCFYSVGLISVLYAHGLVGDHLEPVFSDDLTGITD